MEIEFDLSKSIEENAAHYFEESKSLRKKIAGLQKAIVITQQKHAQKLAVQQNQKQSTSNKNFENQKKKWFESFRWFFTSDALLVVGGRDAKTNEEIVKHRMKEKDIYFHAEVFGAPHCIIVAPEEFASHASKDFVAPQQSMKEAAQFAVTFSKAFEEGRAQADAYSVKPEQVSKSAKSGESMGTGAFMIYGERNWFRKSALSCAIGFFDAQKKLMCAPTSAVKKHCKFFIELRQGSMNKNDAAKRLKNLFDAKGFVFPLEEFVSKLPNGSFEIISK